MGRYLGTIEATGSRLWWIPPGSAPREPLPNVGARSPDGPNWGYVGSGPLDAAETILVHASGRTEVAAGLVRRFCQDHLARQPQLEPLNLPASTVNAWLTRRGVLAPGPNHPVPHRTHVAGAPERWAVSLDGWDFLVIDPPPVDTATPVVRVAVADLDQVGEYRDDRTVALTDQGEVWQPRRRARVGVEDLPFGGWAVNVDGHDLVVIERHAERADLLRVAVYDRRRDSGFLVLDTDIRYRQLPNRPGPVLPAERLRRLSDTAPGREPPGR